MSFTIRHEDEITTVQLVGSITGKDLLNAAQTLLDHPHFDQRPPYIWDARGVTELLLELDEMRAIRGVWMECLKRLETPVSRRSAIVAVRHVDQSTARFFRAYFREQPIRIFDNVEAAHTWVRG